jgi:hypothetical protein
MDNIWINYPVLAGGAMKIESLAIELADHLEAIAATLRHHATMSDTTPPMERPSTAEVDRPRTPSEVLAEARRRHPLLGSHQEMALSRLAEAHPMGLSASQINENESALPNTYTTLDKLAELGLVRRQEGRPRRYFLGQCWNDSTTLRR